MSKVTIISFQNLEIVYTDLSNLSIEEANPGMWEAVDVISGHTLKSVYSLINFENMRFNKKIIETIKVISKKNAPYIVATAVIGLTSMTRLIAKSMIVFGNRNARVFDEIEEAKAWLLAESKTQS